MNRLNQMQPLEKYEAAQIIGRYFGKEFSKEEAEEIGSRFESSHDILILSLRSICGENDSNN